MARPIVEKAEIIARTEKSAEGTVEKLNSLIERYGNEKYGQTLSKYVPGAGKCLSAPLSVMYEVTLGLWHVYESKPERAIEVAKALWKEGYREDRIIATNLLQRASASKPDEVLEFVKEALPQLSNWEVCDALAVRALGNIASRQPEKILKLASELVRSESKWVRRFGAAVMIPLVKEEKLLKDVLKNACWLMKDKEKEARLGVSWLLRKASKSHPGEIVAFIKLWLAKPSAETKEIIRNSIKYLPEKERKNIENMLKP